jgi:methylthioribose-1-phosphate isomerase
MGPIEILPTVRLVRGKLRIIDQTRLPAHYEILDIGRVDDVCEAILHLRVRGAPAIGVAGAYGVLIAIEEWSREWVFDSAAGTGLVSAVRPEQAGKHLPTLDELRDALERAAARIVMTRPTAVNLSAALARMRRVWLRDGDVGAILFELLREADAVLEEDLAMCGALSAHGSALIADGDAVLTHCNTGGLATGGVGTALGVVFAAAGAGKRVRVYADETRPLLQGARLTAWECKRQGLPVTVLVEGAAASLLSAREVACVIVGADRIAANGDTANKVGTHGLAILARRFGVPFYVAAPSSSIDASLPDGTGIPIEQRGGAEVTSFAGAPVAPEGVDVYNPAFDVTPAELVDAIVTERGVHRPPFRFTASA